MSDIFGGSCSASLDTRQISRALTLRGFFMPPWMKMFELQEGLYAPIYNTIGA
jgi:hypothetical protein